MVLGIAKHSESLEEYVVYEHLEKESGQIELWIRPKDMFLETVMQEGIKIPRFKFIEDEQN